MRRHQAHKEPSTRQLRVAEQLRHIIAEIFERQEFHDPLLLATSLTVSEVRIGPDLRNATVFVLPFGGKTTDELLAALHRLAPHVRHLIGQRARLRSVPQIHFVWDTAFDQADRIEQLLHDPRVARDLEQDDSPPEAPDAA